MPEQNRPSSAGRRSGQSAAARHFGATPRRRETQQPAKPAEALPQARPAHLEWVVTAQLLSTFAQLGLPPALREIVFPNRSSWGTHENYVVGGPTSAAHDQASRSLADAVSRRIEGMDTRAMLRGRVGQDPVSQAKANLANPAAWRTMHLPSSDGPGRGGR